MGKDGGVGNQGSLTRRAPARRRSGGRALLLLAVAAMLVTAACASSTPTDTTSATSTTVAANANAKKAGVEFAAAPKGPVGPDSTQANKCFALKAFRYLVAMPESGRFFKDKLATTPKVADDRLQTLRHQLEAAIPDVAPDVATLADDAHARLQLEAPTSGLAMLGSGPDKHLLTYLTTNCASNAVPA